MTKTFDFTFLEHLRAGHDGQARFRFVMSRTTRKGTHDIQDVELLISRGNLCNLVQQLKKFADAERAAVAKLPL